MRGNSYKKYRKEPQIKIGSKKENVLYSEKNINPELNFFNKQLSREEFASNMRKKNQKEEFSTLSKNFQDNYMGPPNLAHQRIDFSNVAGKIGQEKREMDINKYQQQPSFAKDQVYNTYINNDKERNNKKYYHNIINNTIFGFCDPSMKYPKTSYQSNYQGKVANLYVNEDNAQFGNCKALNGDNVGNCECNLHKLAEKYGLKCETNIQQTFGFPTIRIYLWKINNVGETLKVRTNFHLEYNQDEFELVIPSMDEKRLFATKEDARANYKRKPIIDFDDEEEEKTTKDEEFVEISIKVKKKDIQRIKEIANDCIEFE